MASLGDAYRAGAERLVNLQGTVRNNWQAYREILRVLVRSLLDETAGEPRVNADAALRLVGAHRRSTRTTRGRRSRPSAARVRRASSPPQPA